MCIRDSFYISFAQKYNSDFVVSDEYEFIHGNDKTDKLIKEKIKEIAEIVKQEQKCLFISEAKNKVTFIRKKRITDQFLEFFKYVKVDPNSYDLDFELLIGIRNKLYHGNAINSSIDISTINLNLYKLAVDLIIKLTSLTSWIKPSQLDADQTACNTSLTQYRLEWLYLLHIYVCAALHQAQSVSGKLAQTLWTKMNIINDINADI